MTEQPPETLDERLRVDLFALIRRARAGANEQLVQQYAGRPVSLSKLKLLHILARPHQRPPRISRVGDLVGVTQCQASKLVASMERARLVDRIDDSQDSRVKRVVLAPKGRALVDEDDELGVGDVDQLIRTLTVAEKRALARGLELVLRRPEIAALRPRDQLP